MSKRSIRITIAGITAQAELNPSRTAEVIWEALPVEAKASTWGDEIYFDIGVDAAAESPREVVDAGDLAYWPPGRAFCIFWGPTPASRGNEIRPASPVNPVGSLVGDVKVFAKVRSGARVIIERG